VFTHRDYDAYGQITAEQYNVQVTQGSTTYPVETILGYAQGIYDADLSMVQFVNRWYDPSTGRFLSEDPTGLGADVNPYRYCGNSPLTRTDPTGQNWNAITITSPSNYGLGSFSSSYGSGVGYSIYGDSAGSSSVSVSSASSSGTSSSPGWEGIGSWLVGGGLNFLSTPSINDTSSSGSLITWDNPLFYSNPTNMDIGVSDTTIWGNPTTNSIISGGSWALDYGSGGGNQGLASVPALNANDLLGSGGVDFNSSVAIIGGNATLIAGEFKGLQIGSSSSTLSMASIGLGGTSSAAGSTSILPGVYSYSFAPSVMIGGGSNGGYHALLAYATTSASGSTFVSNVLNATLHTVGAVGQIGAGVAETVGGLGLIGLAVAGEVVSWGGATVPAIAVGAAGGAISYDGVNRILNGVWSLGSGVPLAPTQIEAAATNVGVAVLGPGIGTGAGDVVGMGLQLSAGLGFDVGVQALGRIGQCEAVFSATPTGSGATNPFANHQWGNPDTIPCFPAEALVHTPDGVREIQTLCEGDLVLAYDLTTKAVVARPVVACMRNWTLNLVKVKMGDEIIWATRIHPFYLPETDEWIPASELKAGMKVLAIDLQSRMIDDVHVMATHEDTFNITVDELHTFFVGEVGLLVHNAAFTSLGATPTEIYGIQNQATGEIVYVGKTTQGIDVRFLQHVNGAHSEWASGFGPVRLTGGNWTAGQAAVWEQHYIDFYGGTTQLQNVRNAISEATYNQIKPLIPNPC
jgi:RHS repeat-associated protein